MVSKVLVIVESPAKAKTIEKLLGRRYTVKASMGHLRDLPRSQFGIDVHSDFEPKYINIRGKGSIIKDLRTAARDASAVLLGPDPDREGEAIAWHLSNLLNLEGQRPCRVEFHEITKEAVQDAVKKPRSIDIERVDAQQARRILDRVVGYQLSPLLWRKIRRGLSAGRVQSVALRLIVDREREISDFVSQEYWTIAADFATQREEVFRAMLVSRNGRKAESLTREEAEQFLADLRRAVFTVTATTTRKSRKSPPPPFTTSSLQQEAFRKLGFPARRTMAVAQQLYEGLELGQSGSVGLITYMRTDSTRIAQTAQEEARAYITEHFGQQYIPDKPNVFQNRGKVQDAHEAIRPTAVPRDPEQLKNHLSSEQYRLYRLIWSRFVASQMKPAILEVTTIKLEGKSENGRYGYRAAGSILVFPGYRKVYLEEAAEKASEATALLPQLEDGQAVNLCEIEAQEHHTQPPPRYSDALLVKAMEEKEIGRPSTYAPTIETLLNRGYIVRKEKQLIPTELGSLVDELLKIHFSSVINVDFTAEMEHKLDQVEEGQLEWKEVVRSFYNPFQDTLRLAEEKIGRREAVDEESEIPCPACGKLMVIKTGPFGRFLACRGFPECRETRPLVEETGISCPRCEAPVVVRQSRRGKKFFGCSKYPECSYVAWDPPSQTRCSACNDWLIPKKSKAGERLLCTNRQCPDKQNQILQDKGRKPASTSLNKKPASTPKSPKKTTKRSSS